VQRLILWASRVVGDLSWRAAAVLERLLLWWRLPPPIARQVLRSSQYVPVRDGTEIAIDIYRPAAAGGALDGPFPVLWAFERYHRARFDRGRLSTRFDREQWLSLLVRHGYVVAIADVRGGGASFGCRTGLVTAHDRWDAYDITEWLAAQPWSTGRIGMFGKSFMGLMQYLAASAAPPHLVAIMPDRTLFDLYAFAYPGGVFRDDYARNWSANVNALDRATAAAPVDEDRDGERLAAAMAQHRNVDVYSYFARLPFRDSMEGGALPYAEQSPSHFLEAIAASGVAVHQLAGWNDLWPRDALLWHCNLSNPRKLVIGPWAHSHQVPWALVRERLRFLDHWLKQVDNGAMNGAAVSYYTIGAPRRSAWRTTSTWPHPRQRPTRFYFGAATPADGGVRVLTTAAPIAATGRDEYVVDYSATTGDGTRWKSGYGREFRYGNLSANDAKALTYTSAPLEQDLEITGHPIVALWVAVDGPDADIFVYLEEVRRSGRSSYITEGVLRVSHRATGDAPYHNLGLPFHRGHAADVITAPMSDAVYATFDLHPISHLVKRGRRLRVSITGADRDNALTSEVQPPPRLEVGRNAAHASFVLLPVVPAAERHG
jgi:uncharacterized protein